MGAPGAGLSSGAGAAIGGGLQALGTVYSAYLNSKSAKKEREQARAKHDLDTKLQISQFNMNQDRLAGLGSVASGRAQFERGKATDVLGSRYSLDSGTGLYNDSTGGSALDSSQYNQAVADAQLSADATARSQLQGQGDYSNLDVNKYTFAGGSGPTPLAKKTGV